jgi:glycosyltransferase involved in cell wall biosynthesis
MTVSARTDLLSAAHGSRPHRASILINGSPLWPPVTGVQRVARGLVRQLLEEAEPGEVAVAGAPPEFGGSSRLLGGRAVRLGWEQAALAVRGRWATSILNLGNLAPLASTRNLVLTYDLHAHRHPGHYRAAWGRSYWMLSAASYRRARFRVTLSRTIADDLEATLGHHVDAVLPPGIDSPFRPVPASRVEAVRDRFRLGDMPYLVVVGWAQPGKRAELALRAHRILRPDVPHALVLAGGGRPDFADVGLTALPPSVVVTGRLVDEDLAAVYAGSHGLLFCTEYEGFGLPPVEALACGSPVASSRLPITEEVLGGLPGVTFVGGSEADRWASAAEALLKDTADPERSRARSAAALARYPWEGKGTRLLQLVRG